MGFLVVLAMASSGGVAHGQSLAEVAKREEARRKAVTVPSRVYTNDDLSAEPDDGVPGKATAAGSVEGVSAVAATPAAASSQPMVLPVSGGGGVAAPAEPEEDRGEAFWRGTITRAREALQRNRLLADALQSRLNALATDIVNRDDPAQRSQLELERQRALAELERVRAEAAAQMQAIADIEEDARKAGVPPGWLR